MFETALLTSFLAVERTGASPLLPKTSVCGSRRSADTSPDSSDRPVGNCSDGTRTRWS